MSTHESTNKTLVTLLPIGGCHIRLYIRIVEGSLKEEIMPLNEGLTAHKRPSRRKYLIPQRNPRLVKLTYSVQY